jgi:PsbP-like protein
LLYYISRGRGRINIHESRTVSILFVTSLFLIICLIVPSSSSRFILLVNAQTDKGNDDDNTTNTTNPSALQQWKTYSDKKLGISLKYPSTWIVKQKTNRLETVPDLSLSYTNELGGKNSFAVFVMPIIGLNNLHANSDVKLAQLLAERVKDEIIKSGQTKGLDMHIIEDVKQHYPIDGEEAFSFLVVGAPPNTSSYTRVVGVVDDGGDNIQLVQESIVSYHKGNFFMFGFTDLSTTFDNPTHLQVRDHILKSIKFLD